MPQDIFASTQSETKQPSNGLDAIVVDSLNQLSAATEKFRVAATSNAAQIEASAPRLDEALRNLEAINESPILSELRGIFDSTYNREAQAAVLQTESMRMQNATARLQASKEVFAAESAVANQPIDALQKQMALKSGMNALESSSISLDAQRGAQELANVTPADLEAAVKSGDVRQLGAHVTLQQAQDRLLQLKTAQRQEALSGLQLQQGALQLDMTKGAYKEYLGSQELANVTDMRILDAADKSGDFSKIGKNVSPGQVRDYKLKWEKSQRDAQSAALAAQSNQADLQRKLLDDLLGPTGMPVSMANALLAEANKAGVDYVEIGKTKDNPGVKVPVEAIRKVISDRTTQNLESGKVTDAAVMTLGAVESQARSTNEQLGRIGAMNTGARPDTKPAEGGELYTVPSSVLPPALRTAVETANRQGQLIEQNIVDPLQKANAYNEVVSRVQKELDAYKQAQISSAADEAKPAVQSFFENGVVTDYTAASKHMTSLMQIPNLFTTNPAMNSAFALFQEGVAAELDKEGFAGLMRQTAEGKKVDSTALMAAMMEAADKKKLPSETVMRRALLHKDASGDSAVDRYNKIHTETLLGLVFEQLEKNVDDSSGATTPLFKGIYNPISGWSNEVAPNGQFSSEQLGRVLYQRVEQARAAGAKIDYSTAINTITNTIGALRSQYTQQYMLPSSPEEGSFTLLLNHNTGANQLAFTINDVIQVMKQVEPVVKADNQQAGAMSAASRSVKVPSQLWR